MQIAFHIGANCTDEDRLLKSVLRNADALLRQGIIVPGPSRYRSLIRETIQSLGTASPAAGTRDILLDAIVENDNARRIVLSNDNFICIPKRVFDHGVFYPQAETKVRGLHQLFPNDDIQLYLGIRNPVAFLQDTFKRSKAADLATFLGLLRPEELRWSDVIRRIKAGAPDTPLTVWCNEDSPLLWEQLIRHQSGVATETAIKGGLDLLSNIITKEGMALVEKTLAEKSPTTDSQRHEIIASIWEDHAIADMIEDEIDPVYFDHGLVAHMTRMYEEDVDTIAGMEGVNLLMPFS